MTRVKICGIRDRLHALEAVEAGADYIGMVFAPSRRQVDPIQAREITGAIRKTNNDVDVVGVFVNAPVPQVNKTAEFCDLDWVQLSGDETWEYGREIARPIIKAVRVGRQSPEDICDQVAKGAEILSAQRFVILLDSEIKGKYGGTGMTFNWGLAQRVAERFTVIMAGGLTPDNVAEAIEMVGPWGVDVSSGVEVDGTKDATKIRAFIAAVRSAGACAPP